MVRWEGRFELALAREQFTSKGMISHTQAFNGQVASLRSLVEIRVLEANTRFQETRWIACRTGVDQW
jgi:hypothetical protein